MSATHLELCSLAVLLAGSASAQVTQRVSVDPNGVQGNFASGEYSVSLSADGRFAGFTSEATNLVAGGHTNGHTHVFRHDRQTAQTIQVSVDSAGAEANLASFTASLSADGRYVAFLSYASNLVPGDTNGQPDVFVHDCLTGQTIRVSVDSAGTQANDASGDYQTGKYCPISADGRFVAFASFATNLVPNDSNGCRDVFVHDLQTGQTSLVSADSTGQFGNNTSVYPSISADGRYVAFASFASNLVLLDTNGKSDIFVRDVQAGQTQRVSVSSSGAQASIDSVVSSISADARFVVFQSDDLVPNDSNGVADVFVRDLLNGQTSLVSVSSAGVQGNGTSGVYGLSLSADGRFAAFSSDATNLVPGDTNGFVDLFVRDRASGSTSRISVSSSGSQGDAASLYPVLSADGRYALYESNSTDLVPGDTNARTDVFLRDSLGGPNFASLCDPGAGGVIACPCANAPSGPGRGCDNSSATGGAVLSASGGTYLSSDSLVFTTTGERPTATSIVLQGTSSPAAGIVYGQGVRCVAGSLKRLYTKPASGGSITAPDFGAGEPPVSVRSAATGDTILSGQSRWYLVFYRDPTVLGGCPGSSTFNATQSGRVTWSP